MMRHLENSRWRKVAQVARNTHHKPAPLPPAPRRGVVWWRSGAWQNSEVAHFRGPEGAMSTRTINRQPDAAHSSTTNLAAAVSVAAPRRAAGFILSPRHRPDPLEALS